MKMASEKLLIVVSVTVILFLLTMMPEPLLTLTQLYKAILCLLLCALIASYWLRSRDP